MVRSGQTQEPASAPAATPRLHALDAHTGLIVTLMAIDHASSFIARVHSQELWGAPLPAYPDAFWFWTRWITHPCAPGFFFLMGTGMALFAGARLARGWTEGRVTRFFVIRGLILVSLQIAARPIPCPSSAGQRSSFTFLTCGYMRPSDSFPHPAAVSRRCISSGWWGLRSSIRSAPSIIDSNNVSRPIRYGGPSDPVSNFPRLPPFSTTDVQKMMITCGNTLLSYGYHKLFDVMPSP